jgi:hypothetical protein
MTGDQLINYRTNLIVLEQHSLAQTSLNQHKAEVRF